MKAHGPRHEAIGLTAVAAYRVVIAGGSGGVGSIGHIVGELFKKEYGLNMEHVPYRGSGPMHTDLLGGTLQFAIDTLTQNVPYIKDGKLRGLAVTSEKTQGGERVYRLAE